ncbi:MAG: transposase, partial [Rickettsia endosymbiont of Ixodes persulcatus]|nr:transposase [Rickettsia endosymbiont of Ixodes persulcatus]
VIFEGNCNKEIFTTYVETILTKELHPGQAVIMDNINFHKDNIIRELILSITGCLNDLKQFLKKLIIDWGKFSLKDKYRKTRLSSLNTLKLLTIMA